MNTLVINKEDLRHNIEKIKECAERSGQDDNGNSLKVIAVVKANGYGLGIVEYTRFLMDNGISSFAVSTKEEALLLREAGIKEEILMLSACSIEEELEKLIENNITLTLSSKEDSRIIESLGEKLGKEIKVHLKIDTGFGRYGFIYSKRDELVETIKNLKHVKVEGTYTHFSVSFFDEKYTKLQFERFINVIEVLKMNEINPGILHVCNSSAFLKYPYMHLNAVRIGSAFLGRLSFKDYLGLKKIANLESKVTEIKNLPKGFNIGYSNSYKTKKETKIAIVPCGYMSGYNVKAEDDLFRIVDKLRFVKNDIKNLFKKEALYVEINNEKYKILGRVGAYHIVLDITGKDVKVGNKVSLEVNPKFVDSSIRREYR